MKTKQYNDIVSLYSDHIYHFLIRIIGDDSIASDITQDVFMQLWNHRNNVDEEKVKSWLFTTAKNRALNHIKKHREKAWDDSMIEPNDEYIVVNSLEYKDMLDQALKLLTGEQRTLILLRDLEGYDYEEIASISGVPHQHVKARLFRARKRLKEVLNALLTPQR